MVVYEEDENGNGRYRLLETVRSTDTSGCARTGPSPKIFITASGPFPGARGGGGAGIRGANPAYWLDRLEAEHENCAPLWSGAWRRKREPTAVERTVPGGALWPFWWLRGALLGGSGAPAHGTGAGGGAAAHEGAGQSAERRRSLGLPAERPCRRAGTERAEPLHQPEIGDQQEISVALLSLGNIALDQGDYAAARARYEQALEIARELGDKFLIAGQLGSLGNIALAQATTPRHGALLEQCLSISPTR
jgi:tetratricopeptide (TPR) repeat protein